MSARQRVIADAQRWFDQGHLLQELRRRVAYRSESQRSDRREVLIMSGEQVWLLPDLGLAGEADFVERVADVCRRALQRGLLPHTNVGLLSGESPEDAVKLGWAHGALLTTFPGDTTMSTVEQVRAFAAGGSARIQR